MKLIKRLLRVPDSGDASVNLELEDAHRRVEEAERRMTRSSKALQARARRNHWAQTVDEAWGGRP